MAAVAVVPRVTRDRLFLEMSHAVGKVHGYAGFKASDSKHPLFNFAVHCKCGWKSKSLPFRTKRLDHLAQYIDHRFDAAEL